MKYLKLNYSCAQYSFIYTDSRMFFTMVRMLLLGFIMYNSIFVPVMGHTAESNSLENRQFPSKKKLIEWGWDMPTPAYLRQNIREMEKKPFNGILFWLWEGANGLNNNGIGGCIFTNRWDEAQFELIYDDCRKIEWEKFTDNFVLIFSASTMDWFSDDDWAAAMHNLTIVTKAAVLARCRGICFDPESYGASPWTYSTQRHSKTKSFQEYKTKARERGAEFMKTIEKRMAKCVIHTMFQLSYFQGVMDESDQAKQEKLMEDHPYSLLPAFLNGMLDAAGPDVIFTDGNEDSYYYTSELDFYRSYHMIRQRALALIAPENVMKYQTQMQVSQAVFIDFPFGLFPASSGIALESEDRKKWFEHNIYFALTTSDEFIWLYSERMNWWTNKDLPLNIVKSIESARTRQSQNAGVEPLDSIWKHLRLKLSIRNAKIKRCSQAPKIDGKLDDAVWRSVSPLDDFLPILIKQNINLQAATRAWITYDDKNLYIAFRCEEPNINEIKSIGEKRDGAIWGDTIELLLAPGKESVPFFHLALNPKNVQWDCLMPERGNGGCYPNVTMSFDPNWKSSTSVELDAWTAEFAIPWVDLGMQAPISGTKLQANLCRTRGVTGELSTWSQNIRNFREEDNFGIWEFQD